MAFFVPDVLGSQGVVFAIFNGTVNLYRLMNACFLSHKIGNCSIAFWDHSGRCINPLVISGVANIINLMYY